MAIPERETVYNETTTTTARPVYTRESSSTGWFVGIIVALALLAIGYLVFSANSGPATTNVDITTPPPVTDTTTTPMTTTPMAPAETAPAPVEPVTPAPVEPAAPAAPVETAPTPAAPVAQ
ncbi:hypothetical protein SAMN02983003_1002 [Devosia enhydra]|uniref:Uncharacterized protein n=1 Tax=Devosia enhydra TaxID=665118 RepID=A0A1K2HWC1_9HYPH|nr:hypothetical protein [Devosia enhydra]SFZ82310.1 hypothetical protein SAMN02983003_1002 [Devosia enhydra]